MTSTERNKVKEIMEKRFIELYERAETPNDEWQFGRVISKNQIHKLIEDVMFEIDIYNITKNYKHE